MTHKHIVLYTLMVVILSTLIIFVGAKYALSEHSWSNPDLNRDGSINVVDLGVLLSNWNSVVVSFNNNSYTPSLVTIPSGASVIFVNNGTQDMWPASDDHPTHTVLSGLDPLHAVPVGQTYIFKFDQVGTWGFHDHINPSITATVVVQ